MDNGRLAMDSEKLTLMRRKEILGVTIAVLWAVFALVIWAAPGGNVLQPLTFWPAWVLTALWILLDTRYRNANARLWVAFAVLTGPVALIFYLVLRPPAPAVCTACGMEMALCEVTCPNCGHQALGHRARSGLHQMWAGLLESLSSESVERAKHTAKYMAIALGTLAAFSHLMLLGRYYGPGRDLMQFLWVVSIAAYWVLLPWWVYLDAKWRRMDAIPWAILTLLTNVFGLVTYLVIRYPDPRTCPQCRAYLTIGLKRCPYCGSEAEPTCPRCQAPVKTDWVFCPACAAQLPSPGAATDPQAAPLMAVSGSVVDAISGLPVPGAEVGADSKADRVFIQTDPLGRFMLSDLQPRPHVIVASAKGYAAEAKPFVPGDSSQLHFSLRPAGEDHS